MHNFIPSNESDDSYDFGDGSDSEIEGGLIDEVGIDAQIGYLNFIVDNMDNINGSVEAANANNDAESPQLTANTDTTEDSVHDDNESLIPDKDSNEAGGSADDCQEEEGNWHFSDSDEEEKGATMEEVFETERPIEAQREQPPDIDVGANVIDVKFHPSSKLIAVATLDSEVVCYNYSTESSEEKHSSEHHDSELRSIQFSKDGSLLLTASTDKSVAVLDVNTFKVKKHYLNAHKVPVYSVCFINNNMFASGDDDGTIKVWDVRKQKAITTFSVGEETVNSIIVDETQKTLIAAVNDGSISAYNLSKRKMIVQSEVYEHPLNCLTEFRNGTRLAVGSNDGSLQIYKWGEFGYPIDTFQEQPAQVNCIEAVGDNRVITGCEDGYIRAINLYPHRFVGVVGHHKEFGVEAISVSHDQRYLASCCHGETVKFWDLQHVYSQETDERKPGVKHRDIRKNLASARERDVEDFFADMHDVSSDEEYRGPAKRPRNVE